MSGQRVRGLTAEGFIPHNHLWYRADRIVEALAEWGWPADRVTLEFGQTSERFARRWYEVKSGHQPYFRLPVVDDMLVALGLNLTVVLGEPDLHSSMTPVAMLARGFEGAAPLSYDELPIKPLKEARPGAKSCRRGHLKTPDNTRMEGGRARCLVCDRERKSPHLHQQERLAI